MRGIRNACGTFKQHITSCLNKACAAVQASSGSEEDSYDDSFIDDLDDGDTSGLTGGRHSNRRHAAPAERKRKAKPHRKDGNRKAGDPRLVPARLQSPGWTLHSPGQVRRLLECVRTCNAVYIHSVVAYSTCARLKQHVSR